jgi:putative hydrolase
MITSDLHMHSTFSDGKNTPEEMVREAIRLGYREIAITDHVRRSSEWLDEFCSEMARLKAAYAADITLYSGIEAKVINLRGDIDARPDFFQKVDLVLAAFHRIPRGDDDYLTREEIVRDSEKALGLWSEAMMRVLENEHVRTIVHPTALFARDAIAVPRGLKKAIARKAAQCGKQFEINTKYHVPDEEFLTLLKQYQVKIVYGSDSHRLEDMKAVISLEA